MPDTNARPLRPGDQLGPYRLVRQLGMGGMGTVFEALDVGLNRSIALKVIIATLAQDHVFRERFTREAQSQAALDSPHVVQVFAYGEVEGRLYLASQLIPDGDLGAMLRAHGAPPPRTAISMLAQVTDGLAEAHRVGLVHRDIKPANVLLRNRGDAVSAYLADFGIARRVDGISGLTTEGFAVGTPSYMAPELHTGGTPGQVSDVYSLGCLLWACLVGRAPYGGTTDYQIVRAHVGAPVPQLVAAGPFEREVNRILAGALAKDPGRRYATASVLRDDLRALERSLPAPAELRPGPGGAGTGGYRPGTTPAVARSAFRGHGPPGWGPPVGPSSGAAPGGRRTVLRMVAGLVALVVLVGGGVATALALAGDDGPTRGSGTGGIGGSGTGGSSPTTTREDRAIASLTAALAEDDDIDEATAGCVAGELVAERGVDDLVKVGFLDDDLQVVEDSSGTLDPSLLADVFTLAFDCVLNSGSASESSPVG